MFFLKRDNIWSGIYENMDSARVYLEQLNKKENSFDTNRWLKRQEVFLKLSEKNIYPRATSLPNFVHSLDNGSILDFGGGSGWVQSFIPESCLYLNYELPDFVRYFSKLNRKSNKFFVKDFDDNQFKKIDVLYSNSVIQYLPTLNEFFSLINRVQPKIILIDDVQVSTSNDFISLQKYYDEFIITRFFSLDKLIVDFEDNGYELVHKKIYNSVFPKNMKPKIGNRKRNDPDRSFPLTLFFKRAN